MTIKPRELLPCETWQFDAYGYNVEIGWLDGKCVADVQACLESLGDYFEFATEAEAVLAVLAWCKDNRRVRTDPDVSIVVTPDGEPVEVPF